MTDRPFVHGLVSEAEELEYWRARAEHAEATARTVLDAIRDAHARWARCEITATQFGNAIAAALEAAP